MSEEVKSFVDKLAAGDNAGAGEAFKDALRVKVGSTLDNHRKDMASNMFNNENTPIPEAEPHSDPKPAVADIGTFTRDGQVQTVNDVQDGQAQLDLTQDGTADTMVGVDVNAGESNS